MSALWASSYRDADWCAQVQAATAGHGADFIIGLSGSAEQDGILLALMGQIAVIGGLGAGGSSTFNMRKTLGELRRSFVGSREQFEDMNRAIEARGIRPAVDAKIGNFEEMREAYDHAASDQTRGEVDIRVADDD